MSKVGFIGYGSMGSMLVNGFMTSGALKPDEVIVTSRTIAKLKHLEHRWPGITIADGNTATAGGSEVVFICVKPLDVLPVLRGIRKNLPNKIHLVSIAACVTIADLETVFPGKITKVIPSLTSELKEGISLVCHNGCVQSEAESRVEQLFQSISGVIRIAEADFEVAADLTSCAPGMIAAMFQNFIEAALRHSALSTESTHKMVVSTLLGTARLLAEKEMTFSEMIDRVATKGGITEEGVKVLNDGLPAVFDEVFDRTLAKHDAVKALVRKQIAEISKRNERWR